MKESIRTYHVKFMVDTIHTETIINVYSRDLVEKLLQKQYTNCKISDVEITEAMK